MHAQAVGGLILNSKLSNAHSTARLSRQWQMQTTPLMASLARPAGNAEPLAAQASKRESCCLCNLQAQPEENMVEHAGTSVAKWIPVQGASLLCFCSLVLLLLLLLLLSAQSHASLQDQDLCQPDRKTCYSLQQSTDSLSFLFRVPPPAVCKQVAEARTS